MLPRVPDSGDWTSSSSPRYNISAPPPAPAPSFFPPASGAEEGHPAPPPASHASGYGIQYDPYASSRSTHPMYPDPARDFPPHHMYPPYGGYGVPMPPVSGEPSDRYDYPPYHPPLYHHQMVMPPPFDGSSSMVPTMPMPSKRPKARIDGSTRKQICQYAEIHPDMRQTDVAAVFHVERSTISKILKQKHKWLALPSEDELGAHRTPPVAPTHRFDPIGYQHRRPSLVSRGGSNTASLPASPRPTGVPAQLPAAPASQPPAQPVEQPMVVPKVEPKIEPGETNSTTDA